MIVRRFLAPALLARIMQSALVVVDSFGGALCSRSVVFVLTGIRLPATMKSKPRRIIFFASSHRRLPPRAGHRTALWLYCVIPWP